MSKLTRELNRSIFPRDFLEEHIGSIDRHVLLGHDQALRDELAQLQADLAAVTQDRDRWKQNFDHQYQITLAEIDERDKLKHELRNRIWTLHYQRMKHLPYGDDGKMDCNTCGRDYVQATDEEVFNWELADAATLMQSKALTPEQHLAASREALRKLRHATRNSPWFMTMEQAKSLLAEIEDALKED